MKKKLILITAMMMNIVLAFACPVCEKQQPKLLRGITHGTGPQSNWDWVIVACMTVVTLYTLFYSVKYLLRPGEKQAAHVKQSILNHF